MPDISVDLVATQKFILYRKKCCMIWFYNFSSKGCSFDQNTYLANLDFPHSWSWQFWNKIQFLPLTGKKWRKSALIGCHQRAFLQWVETSWNHDSVKAILFYALINFGTVVKNTKGTKWASELRLSIGTVCNCDFNANFLTFSDKGRKFEFMVSYYYYCSCKAGGWKMRALHHNWFEPNVIGDNLSYAPFRNLPLQCLLPFFMQYPHSRLAAGQPRPNVTTEVFFFTGILTR